MYKVVKEGSDEQLAVTVNAMLAKGWETCGGMAVAFCGNAKYIFFQAMVNDETPQPIKPSEQKKG